MILTEEDAAGKTCHQTFAAPAVVSIFDKTELHREAGPFPCIASACMAWRWQPLMADDAFLVAVKKATEQHPGQGKAAAHVTANRAAYGLPDKPFRGWCGLAGEPR